MPGNHPGSHGPGLTVRRGAASERDVLGERYWSISTRRTVTIGISSRIG